MQIAQTMNKMENTDLEALGFVVVIVILSRRQLLDLAKTGCEQTHTHTHKNNNKVHLFSQHHYFISIKALFVV